MTDGLSFSSRIYACLLTFYPEDLRRDYGADMALVFAEDLAAARRETGVRGTICVWRWTVGDFLRLALPCWISTPALRMPAISFALFAGMMPGILLAGLGHPANALPNFQGLRFALLLPLFSAPVIGLASLCACRRTRFASMRDGINGGEEHLPCLKLAL
jgi:hypothetical protein